MQSWARSSCRGELAMAGIVDRRRATIVKSKGWSRRWMCICVYVYVGICKGETLFLC